MHIYINDYIYTHSVRKYTDLLCRPPTNKCMIVLNLGLQRLPGDTFRIDMHSLCSCQACGGGSGCSKSMECQSCMKIH